MNFQTDRTENAEVKEGLKALAEVYTDAWVDYHAIKNEKGEVMDWDYHQFLIDIYNDQNDNLVVIKAAQIGMSTLEILKNFRDAEKQRMDIIYTLPSDADVSVFVGGKVNRIIANNKHLEALTADKDSVEQKQIGKSMLYFRGTWTKKSAIMVTADRLVHDEKDSSKQDVIADYQARLQHSKFKQTHVFSHPSVPNSGVDIEWKMSDQKEWFIHCPQCNHEQFLSWNTEDPARMSIDLVSKLFICKKCRATLSNQDRACGRWVARFNCKKHPEIKWSGYHISLLMAPWISAADIIAKYNEVMEGKQTMDFFYNKILGLPFAGSGNVVLEDTIKGVWTSEKNTSTGRLIVGVDTGVKLNYVIGNKNGLFGYGEMKDYMPDSANNLALHETIEYFLKQFPESIVVIDQGGDIIGPRKLREKYPGRVYLCHYARDRKTMQLIRWGEKEENGNVTVDRNRMIQLVIGEFIDKRIKLFNGTTKEDWHEYWLHWSHIYRRWEDDISVGTKRGVWLRSDRDDWVHATVYWRTGVDRFGGKGGIVGLGTELEPNSYMIEQDQTIAFDPHKMFGYNPKYDANVNLEKENPWWADDDEPDWRDV